MSKIGWYKKVRGVKTINNIVSVGLEPKARRVVAIVGFCLPGGMLSRHITAGNTFAFITEILVSFPTMSLRM